MNVIADASLPGIVRAFPLPFQLHTYNTRDDLIAKLPGMDVLVCRSTLKVDEPLLQNSAIKMVGTASSGVDHVDTAYLKHRGIKLLDAKGCNALSVADYVVSCIAYLNSHLNRQPIKAGVIGIGAVGSEVVKRLTALGLEVLKYDPPKAKIDPAFTSCTFESLLACDLICVHADLNHHPESPSHDLINAAVLGQLKPDTVIINASRGGIVNEDALLSSKTPLIYCTDVFLNEPQINPAIVAKATLATPHIAGHSLEAKFRAVAMISAQLHALNALQLPEYDAPEAPVVQEYNSNQPWEAQILALYNPIHETMQLKQSRQIHQTFIELRKAHQTRHDFYTCFSSDQHLITS